jgi:D-tyrosyl-tRNA(Tyr) deacylase
VRAVVQRVRAASVAVAGEVIAEIGAGALVLLGVSRDDDASRARALAGRIAVLRVFDDEDGRMNRSLLDVGGEMLVVSQFTLWGDCRAGRRPSWSRAAPGDDALPLYEAFIAASHDLGVPVKHGRFGAAMQVGLTNDGPVTLLLDTEGAF